jgi:fructose/tagatose bisphosphate aldolase
VRTIKVKWTGIRPLVMHNGLMADPTNPLVRRIKEITSKGSKKLTDADYEERDRLEWEAGLYWDSNDGLIMPSDNIERCIQLGAQKSRIGKDVQAAVFCAVPHVVINYTGPKDMEKLYADPRFTLRKGVAVQKSRIIRIRPMIPTGWSMTFDVEFDEGIVNPKNLMKAMADAGSLVGLGDWRPKFGRFLVEEV